MKTKYLVLILIITMLAPSLFALPTRALVVTDYIVQTNILNGSSGLYSSTSNQIQLWWDSAYVTLKGPLTIHNVLYEYTNGQWQNRVTVEDTVITLKTSAETIKFDVKDVFNANWQVVTDRTRELTLSTYTQPTPSPTPTPTTTPTPTGNLFINDYVTQTNLQNGVSGSYNAATKQIQLWWSGTYVTLKGPIQIHNQLIDTTNGKWQIVEDTRTTLQTSTNTQTFVVTETFNSNWQPIIDYTRILTISSYTSPAPTTTPIPTITPTPTPLPSKPMLAAFLGPSDLSATQVQTIINNWKTQTGKGLAYYATVGSFGYSNSPSPMYTLDTYKSLVQQSLITGVIYTWNPAYNNDQLTGQQCITEIVAGKYDAYIHQEAQRAKNVGYPIIIRFGTEMNGYWAGWGNDPVAFKQAWIRVVDIFRQEGASNVKFFWCPNYNSNPTSRSFTNYYPGDAYVDYVGVDMYANSQYNTWGTAERQFTDPSGNVYDTYTNKPFIIGEFGLNSVLTDSQNAQWLTGFFNSIDSRSRVVAITHWRETWNGAAVDLYPQAFSVYKNRIANYLP